MRFHNLSLNVKPIRLKPDGSGFTVAAGTTTVNGDEVDTRGFEGVMFRIAFGTITSGAVTSIKLQHNDVSGTGQADIAGSSQTVLDTDDNKIFQSDVYRPTKRYMRMVTTRGTANAVIDYQEVILYRSFPTVPPSTDTTVGGTERFNSPASGTA